MRKKVIFILYFSVLTRTIFSQNFPGWFTYDTTSSPLPSSLVTTVAVDNQNDLWVGTSAGLARFSELLNWTIFNTSNSGIADNWINKIKFDPQGKLWIATAAGGVSVLSNNMFQNYSVINSPLLTNQINDFEFEATGAVWIATEGAGLYKFEGGVWTNYNAQLTGFAMNNIRALRMDGQQNLWIGTNEAGLLKFSNGIFTQYSPLNSDLPFWSVRALSVDNQDDLWIGLSSSSNDSCLVKYAQNTFTIFSNPGIPELKFTNVWDIYIDNSGKKWISTNDDKYGLITYNDTTFSVFNFGSSGLASNRNYAVVADADTNIWIATLKGLNILNEKNIFLNEENFVLNSLAVKIFPNPVADYLQISSDNAIAKGHLSIKSLDGREFAKFQFAGENHVFNVQHLPSGIYFVELHSNSGNYFSKLLKI
jgi:ligand-binding sensor domain-containing protein